MREVPAVGGRRAKAMLDRDIGGFYVFAVANLLTWEMLRQRQGLRRQLRSPIELAAETPLGRRMTIRLNGQSSPDVKIRARVVGEEGDPIGPAFFDQGIRRLPGYHPRRGVAHSAVMEHTPQIDRHTN